MWGYAHENEVLGRAVVTFWQNQEDAEDVIEVLRAEEKWMGEMTAKRKDGSHFVAQLSAHMVKNEAGLSLCLMASFVDITERKKAEQSLRQSKEKFTTVFLTNPAGMVFTSLKNGHVIDVNESFTAITGYSRQESLGRTSLELGFWPTPGDRKRVTQKLKTHGFFRDLEFAYRHKSGNIREGIFSLAVVDIEDEPCIITAMFDVTQRKRAEEKTRRLNKTLEQRVAECTTELESRAEELQQLALDLSDAEDRERRHIASILHDDFQQQLAYIKIKLDLLRKNADKKFALLAQLTGECIEKSRNLSYEIDPPALHRSGLLAALGVLAKDMEIKYGLAVTVRTQPGVELASFTLASILYRSVKELLFNVVKHAGVESAVMDVRSKNRMICIRVEDCGNGFDYDAVRAGQGGGASFGLYNIEDRMTFLGGSLKVNTKPGKGCYVALTVPKDVSRKTAAPEAPLVDTVKQELMGGVPISAL
jgi:PAS domain S-box-containing protein